MTNPLVYSEQLLAQTAWLERLSRELVSNADLAADLAQDTLTAALQRPGPKHASVRAWLERIARNLAAGGVRAHYRRLRRERVRARVEVLPDTAETIARFEMHRSVVDAVRALREPIRTTLLLRFWEDLAPREIAVRMDAPVETVRTRIKRGLHELRSRLDGACGGREAWSGTLLSFTCGHGLATVGAVTNLTGIGLLMHSKTLALGAMAAIGLIGVIAWNLATPEATDPGLPGGEPELAATARAGARTSTRAPSPDTTSAANRTSMNEAEEPGSDREEAWWSGQVSDDDLRPIEDVEIALLTEEEANTHGRYDDPGLTPEAVEILRCRWTLWHLSDRGWMKDREVLGKVFGTERVTRTDATGTFRFVRSAARGPRVLALWSPDLGMRFHPVAARDGDLAAAVERVICPRWPKLRGRVTIDGELEQPVRVFVDPEERGVPRVLKFFTDAAGRFETPQIPPGVQSIRFVLAEHFDVEESFELTRDRTIDRRMTPYPRVQIRLVDGAGVAWTRLRLRERGWEPDEMKFLMLREDRQTKTALDADTEAWRSRAVLRFEAEEGVLVGAVDDPLALWLSVWQGPERVSAVRLPEHDVDQAVLVVPPPRTMSRLEVSVRLGAGPSEEQPMPKVRVELGAMGGLSSYAFEPAVTEEGERDRFVLEVPGFLRGQAARLVVTAGGYAEQAVNVPIPMQGQPMPVRVEMLHAPHALAVRVVDESGRPLVGARVKIASPVGEALRGLRRSIGDTDEHGRFEFGDLARQRVRVFASARGYAAASGVASTDQREPLTIRMLPGVERTFDVAELGDAIYIVRVLDARGAALKDDRVFGAGYLGRTFRIRLSVHAQKLELWRPRGTEPARVIELAR